MYGAVDPILNAAEAVMDRQVSRAEARESFVDARFLELRGALQHMPFGRVRPIWSSDPKPTIALELISWVHETESNPERVIAEAFASGIERDALIERFCEARANAEADRLADDYFARAA